MKIAMFTDAYFPRVNGVAVSVKSYAEQLSSLGHDVCIVCLEYTEEQQKRSFFDEKKKDISSPFKVFRIPSLSVLFSKEDRMVKLNTWHLVKNYMDDFAPDVIHINSEWSVGYLGSIYARHRKIPFVFTFHTMWEDYLSNYVNFLPNVSLRKIGSGIVKYYLKRADEIITPTKRIAEVVKKYGINKDTDILPTGIPQDKLNFTITKNLVFRKKLFSRFPLLKNKQILLYVGRVVEEKNLGFLLDVLEELNKKLKNIALLIVGNGPYLEPLKELASQKKLEKQVFFTGYIPEDELVYFYKASKVFVFPSKTETQGLVTVEAMLCSVPVVAIGELGTLDVMQGDNGGFMVKDDLYEFTDKVSLLLTDGELWRTKSQQAFNWGQKWKISSLTPTLLECYNKAINNKKSGIHEK